MADDIRSLKEKAAEYAQKGQNRKAIQAYEALLKLQPGDTRTLHRLGELWSKENDKSRATDSFIQAANGYLEEGFADRAVAVLRQALAVDPASESANQLLVDALVAKNSEREAVRHLLQLAATFEKAGNTDKQRAALERAKEIAPDDPDLTWQAARLKAQAGKPDEVREAYQQALPMLEKAGRWAELVEAAKKLVGLEKDSIEPNQLLALGYLQLGRHAEAVEVMQHTLNLKSDDLRTLSLLAQSYFGKGDTGRAIGTYKRLIRLARSNGNSEAEKEAQAQLDKIRGGPKQSSPNPPDLSEE